MAIYAVGGNALSDPALRGDDSKQAANEVMSRVLEDVVDLLESGMRVVITHGNGPQVGELLMMEEALVDLRRHKGEHSAQPLGLDNWVAATQGTLGHEIATQLDNTLRRRCRHEQVVTLLTRVEVEENDPAFERPTKPVGPSIDDLDQVPETWVLGVTSDVGPRRLVASPKPISIIDTPAISALIEVGAVVVCGGGGGIPVVSKTGGLIGVEAVIDKDRVSSLLALSLDADYLFISTAVDAVRLNFGEPNEEVVHSLCISEAKNHLANGQFPKGSMGPKIEALVDAKINSEKMGVFLCAPGMAIKTLRGESGTSFLLD